MTPHARQADTMAVVIGGSMAGLLAARVLAERYMTVTIVERDTLPTAVEPRKGVPQARHAHALLARGQQALEELFPGLTQRLLEQGAPRGHGRFFSGGGYLYPARVGPGGLFVSRPLLEAEVRARVLARPNVRLMENRAARGLAAGAGERVAGVLLDGDDMLAADLVVDASGRGSQAPAWLEALGYPAPAVELVDVRMGYSSRLYRREPEHLGGDLMVNIAPTPANPRACGMLAQEGERWIVTLAGYFGDYPPADDQGYLDFARSLPTPDVYELIRAATPLSQPTTYKFPANQWRHYEKLTRFPEGLLVAGDALCSFTPIYGQGMTVAALEALALRDCLAEGAAPSAQRFFRRAAVAVAGAWTITVGNDRRLAGADAARRPPARVLNWYMDKLLITARRDAELSAAFTQVANLLAAPPSLLRPRRAWRVLRSSLRRAPGHGQTEPVSSLAPG